MDHNRMPSISVVIPTLDEEMYIGGCLRALREQDFDGDYEIIVVDGGSRDKTVGIARKLADRVIVSKGACPVGAARNIGADAAEAGIVAFIDADTLASQKWLRSINDSINDGVMGAAGPVLPLNGSRKDLFFCELQNWVAENILTKSKVFLFGGLNCAYRKDAFMKAGGFSEDVKIFEDINLSLRLSKLGRLRYNGKMAVCTSTRRLRKYGYARMVALYAANWVLLPLGKNIGNYPPVR